MRTKETTATGSRPKSNRSWLPIALVVCFFIAYNSTSYPQQKGQWSPGQFGLNAGVDPDPGVTYANMALKLLGRPIEWPQRKRIPGITGSYSVWVDENISYYVPKYKFLGGYFMPYITTQLGER